MGKAKKNWLKNKKKRTRKKEKKEENKEDKKEQEAGEQSSKDLILPFAYKKYIKLMLTWKKITFVYLLS